MVTKGEKTRGRMKWEAGVKRRKLLYTEWIHKVLLYSIQNHIHYPRINQGGKEYFKPKCV